MSRSLVIGATLCAAAAVIAGMYFGMYRPLAKRAASQQAIVTERANEHAAEIDGLRKHFQAQQANLQSQLAAEQQKSAQALAAVEQIRVEAAKQAPAAAATAEGASEKPQVAKAEAVGAKPAAKASSSRAARKAAAHKAQAAAAKPEPAKAQSAATSTDAEPQFDRETRRALRENMDDDPIGGLEGM
jgi:hypothetical protein